MLFFSILLSVLFGFPIAWFAMGFWLSNSNDRGSLKGSFHDFSDKSSVTLLKANDNIK